MSDQFLTALRTSHVVAVQATLEPADGSTPVVVPVVGGQVTIDRTAAIRRRGTLEIPHTVADDLQNPVDVSALPFGGYALVERGVRHGDGTRELVTLGRLRIDAVSRRTTEGTLSLELSDRMAQVEDEPLLTPFVPTTGATQAIQALVYDVFGDAITYHLLTDYASEPVIVDAVYTDRVKAIHELAATVAAEAYFDADGDLVVAPADSSALPPVWGIDVGLTGVLVDVDENLDRTETVNGVLVVGQASADLPPFSALVVDDDPTSLTYWGGPFGKVAAVIESASVQTAAQAQAQAAAELERRIGLARNLTLTVVPNPALEPGDPVQVTFRGGRQEDHIVEALTVNLEASSPIELASRTPTQAAMLRTLEGAFAWRELRGTVAA